MNALPVAVPHKRVGRRPRCFGPSAAVIALLGLGMLLSRPAPVAAQLAGGICIPSTIPYTSPTWYPAYTLPFPPTATVPQCYTEEGPAIYRGILTGIWSAANGNAIVSEW